LECEKINRIYQYIEIDKDKMLAASFDLNRVRDGQEEEVGVENKCVPALIVPTHPNTSCAVAFLDQRLPSNNSNNNNNSEVIVVVLC